jgi:hypothetical protein
MCRMREPKKVALEIGERFIVLQLLPEKANFVNMKLIRELKEALAPTTEEAEAIDLKQTDEGHLQWNNEKAKEVVAEIGFDPKALVMVIDALETLNKAEELEEKHFSVFEKFVQVKTDDGEKVVGKVD